VKLRPEECVVLTFDRLPGSPRDKSDRHEYRSGRRERRVPRASVSKVSSGAHVDTLADFDSGRLRNTIVGTAIIWACARIAAWKDVERLRSGVGNALLMRWSGLVSLA